MGSPVQAFSLPSGEVNRVVLKPAIGLIIGLGLGYLVLDRFDWWTVLTCLLLFAPFYVFLRRREYIRVSATHIMARDDSGGTLSLPWEEQVSISVVRRGALSGYALEAKGATNRLFIPKAIAENQDFRALVRQFAPPGHALRGLDAL